MSHLFSEIESCSHGKSRWVGVSVCPLQINKQTSVFKSALAEQTLGNDSRSSFWCLIYAILTQSHAFLQKAHPVLPDPELYQGVLPAPQLHWLSCACNPKPMAASLSWPSPGWQPWLGRLLIQPQRVLNWREREREREREISMCIWAMFERREQRRKRCWSWEHSLELNSRNHFGTYPGMVLPHLGKSRQLKRTIPTS